jgi:hypothetical protein
MLQKAALDAIIRHTYARSRLRLAFAKFQHDSPEITIWKPVVEHLLSAKSRGSDLPRTQSIYACTEIRKCRDDLTSRDRSKRHLIFLNCFQACTNT